jgi:hypothetical protein
MSQEEVMAQLLAELRANTGPDGRWKGSYEEWERFWERYDAAQPTEPTEDEREQCLDMDWAHNDPQVQELYPDKVVAVYRRKVVAVGDNPNTVLEEAERVTGRPQNKIAVVTVLGPRTLFSPR